MSIVSRWLTSVTARAGSVLHPRAAESRMEEEFRFHVEMETAQRIREGVPPDVARREAMITSGGVERHKEEMRDERGRRWADDFWADVRFGIRQLRKNPGFTTIVLITLALGIGATTAIFSVVNGVILAPLPFGDPAQLVHIESTRDLFAESGGVPVPNEAYDGAFINHPDTDLAGPVLNTSGVPWHALYYKKNYPRLQRIKARWDPRNVFRHALSIRAG